MKSPDKPIAEKVFEEAVNAYATAVYAPLGGHSSGLLLPSELYLDNLSESLLTMVEAAQVLDPTNPWMVAQQGLRKIRSGLDRTQIFTDESVQSGVMLEINERRGVIDKVTEE